MVLMAVEEARGSTLVSNRDLIQGLEVEAEAVTTTLGAEAGGLLAMEATVIMAVL
jgi:hypothetical protein